MRPSARHSVRRLLAVCTVIAVLGVLAPVASAGTQKPFHLKKVCDTGTHCVVTFSNFSGIPAGSEINYTGTPPDHLVPVLTVKNGSVSGACAIGSVFATPSTPGSCDLEGGTGRLTQFHLDAAVTFDGTFWYWDGWYWFGN
jgi:hypothetical protein